MYQINFQQPVPVHFIGIGGISMSGLASILLKEGFTVSGSDARLSELTELLQKQGARIFCPQSADNIPEKTAVVVFTAAVHPDNPEYAQAVKLGIPMLTRAQLLEQVMSNYEHSVAVAGTHGKTTTTSLLACILMAANMDPTVSVGGILHEIGGNIRVGSSENFIAEACEYTNSFLSLYPKIGIVLNIDKDHMDFFKDLDDIRSSFHRFAENIQADGFFIVNGDVPQLSGICDGISASVVSYGNEKSDYYPASVSYDNWGNGTFHLMHKGEDLGEFSLNIPGSHNVSNAVAALAAAHLMGISAADCRRGIALFHGADRRFQKKGVLKSGAVIIDDYAHHPTEISATLAVADKYPHQKVWCIFQPHTYTRTRALMDEFARALSAADCVILADIYAAREKDTLGISSDDLCRKIAALGTEAVYLDSFDKIKDYIRTHAGKGDIVLTMGAGDVVKIGEELLDKDCG